MTQTFSDHGGCFFAATLEDDASDADVFWDPAVSTMVVPAVATPGAWNVIDDSRQATHVSLLLSDSQQHLLFRRHPLRTQLSVTGTSLLTPCRLLTELEVPRSLAPRRLQAIDEFNRLLGSTDQRVRRDDGVARLSFVLRALDAALAGATQREIAELLFGRARVERDWRDPSGYVRDRVRRAVRRGRALMAGAYLKLLA